MSTLSAGVGDVFVIDLIAPVQITATQADEQIYTAPLAFRILEAIPQGGITGGTVSALSFTVENGTTDIVTSISTFAAAARVTTAVEPVSAALALVAKGDVLHLDSTVTGGSSPTFNGAGVTLVCQRV